MVNIAEKYYIGNVMRGSIVIDGGGYRGDWCRYMADAYEARLYVFEPMPKNMITIRKVMEGYPHAVLIQKALYDKDGEETLYVTGNRDGCSLYDRSKKKPIVKRIKIETMRLGTFIEEYKITEPIDMMKLNVEGAEIQILQDMDKTLAKQIRSICFSAHGGKIVDESEVAKTIAHLRGLGYNVLPHTFGKNRYACLREG